MERLYKKYVNETIDENGLLTNITYNIPKNFNFGFDVVDELAIKSPDKNALVWVSAKGLSKIFSFKDIKEYSNKTANYFKANGVKKGDKVMVVLKRRYEFWFTIIALHK